MSIMSLLSIEKTRKECFVLVGGVNCFGVIVRCLRISRDVDLTGGRIWWSRLLVTLENKRSSRDAKNFFNFRIVRRKVVKPYKFIK